MTEICLRVSAEKERSGAVDPTVAVPGTGILYIPVVYTTLFIVVEIASISISCARYIHT